MRYHNFTGGNYKTVDRGLSMNSIWIQGIYMVGIGHHRLPMLSTPIPVIQLYVKNDESGSGMIYRFHQIAAKGMENAVPRNDIHLMASARLVVLFIENGKGSF